MQILTSSEISLCQPDRRKGCSACCGLFNFRDLSYRSLSGFLKRGKKRAADPGMDASETIEDIDRKSALRENAHVCPYQGFISGNKPGCLIHPAVAGTDARDVSLFGRKICGDFICPAHSLLNDSGKKMLIRHVANWYHYSVAIIDPESFSWILNQALEKIRVSRKKEKILGKLLPRALEIHAARLCALRGPVFFYSISEYNLHKPKFSLMYDSEIIRVEKAQIMDTMRRMI